MDFILVGGINLVMIQVAQHVSQHLYGKDKDILLARLRRIEGQARGIHRMIEDDRYCPEVVQQLTALSRAVREVSLLLLQDHVEGCMADTVQHGYGEDIIRELIAVIRRTMRT